jgi:hypothetical protein
MSGTAVTDSQIAEWRHTGHPYKVIAAEIATWALEQDRGTIVPGNETFAGDLPIVASDSTWKHAKSFLEGIGVLYRNDGPYLVS